MSFVITRRLDLRDHRGADVVLAVARAMEPLATDALIEAIASDEHAVGVIATWARRVGYELLESSRFDRTFRFVLRKGDGGGWPSGREGRNKVATAA